MQAADKVQNKNPANSDITVLVADDDEALRLMVRHLFSRDTYNVIEAENGEAAVKMCSKYKPSLILMDAVMPVMDGFEACRNIRKMMPGNDTIILMMTGLDDEVTVERAFNSGANDFITKPIQWAVLRQRTAHMIETTLKERKLKEYDEHFNRINKMEALGQLASGVAHNFNNFLATMLGYTELLSDHCDMTDEKVSKYIGEITRAGARAQDVVRQLQNYSMDIKGDYSSVSPRRVLDEIFAIMRATMSSRILLECHVEDDLDKLFLDSMQVKQCLVNMVINASEAIPVNGTIQLSASRYHAKNQHCASCEKPIEDGEYIAFTVTDSGEGIAAGDVHRIFEPFYTSKSVTSHAGMGLSIVHGVMHNHHGHVLVSSANGKTAISLLFPMTPLGQ